METSRLNILFLTPRFPFPLIGGDRLKQYHIISYLARKHYVTVVTFFQGEKIPDEYISEIKKTGAELHIILLNPLKAVFGILPCLFKYPLEIAYYTQPEFALKVNKLMAEREYDVSFSFFMRSAEYVKKGNFKKILMSEDCRTVYQKRSYTETSNLLQKAVRFWEYMMLRKYEPLIVNFFDIVTLVSQNDINLMMERNPAAAYRILSNGTDLKKFYMPDEILVREGILFAGKLDIWANVLMIKRIVNEILPLVREKDRDVKLVVAGANPPKAIKSLASDLLEVHAGVPDMVPYLQKAALFLHPHSGGSGIQNKLLEAMACGCPVVTTPTGIQGISAVNGESVLIGNSNIELAEHTAFLLKNPDKAAKIGKAGHDIIEKYHSWNVVYEQLELILKELFPSKIK